MPILSLQKRLRELGRIRMGVQTPTGRTGKNGQPTYRPEKLDRFRITSVSRPLLEKVAALYGGEVQEWDNNGTPQFEVITTSTRLPVFVPPQPVTQWFELWSGGGCQRRCDGETEMLKDRPCLCGPDPEQRQCKPTTRLNVILRDVEGIGVWRLESHGYYSAVELPDVAEFLAHTGGYAPAWLSMEQRTAIREGQTRHWMVPTLEVDVTPAALLASKGSTGQIGPGAPAALPAAASPVAPVAPTEVVLAEWVSEIQAARTLDDLRLLWKRRPQEPLPADAQSALTTKAAELRAKEAGEQEAAAESADTLWREALAAAPEDWSTVDVEKHFVEVTGVEPSVATAQDMRRYLDTAYPIATRATELTTSTDGKPASAAQKSKLGAIMGEGLITDDGQRHYITSQVLGCTITSWNQLTVDDASALIEALEPLAKQGPLAEVYPDLPAAGS